MSNLNSGRLVNVSEGGGEQFPRCWGRWEEMRPKWPGTVLMADEKLVEKENVTSWSLVLYPSVFRFVRLLMFFLMASTCLRLVYFFKNFGVFLDCLWQNKKQGPAKWRSLNVSIKKFQLLKEKTVSQYFGRVGIPDGPDYVSIVPSWGILPVMVMTSSWSVSSCRPWSVWLSRTLDVATTASWGLFSWSIRGQEGTVRWLVCLENLRM